MAKKTENAKSNYGNRVAVSILAYLLIGIIWYFVDEDAKKDSITRFHVKQGLVLLIFSIIYSIVVSIIVTILATIFIFIPGVGLALIMVFNLLYLIPLILMIIGIVNAAGEKETELPIIGKFGNKLNL